MFRKILKVFIILACIAVVLGIAGLVILKSVFTEDIVRGYVNDAAKKYIGREVKYDRLSFNFIGITLNNLSISEYPNFSKGTFATVDKFVIKVRLLPLFKKQIRVSVVGVNGLDIKIVRNKNNKYNFDDILRKFNSSPSQAGVSSQSKGSAGINIKDVSLGRFYIKNSNISFEDLRSGVTVAVKNLNIDMRNMNFGTAFALSSDFLFNYQSLKSKQSFNFPINVEAKVNLKDLDFAAAIVEISSFKTNLGNAAITAHATLQNFKALQISTSIQADSLDNSALKQFVTDLPQFRIDRINVNASINADLEKGYADIKNSEIIIGNSKANISGNIKWQNDFDYKIQASADLDLATFSKIIPDVSERYNPQGNIKTDIMATSKAITAAVTVENASFKYDPMFVADSIQAIINIHSFKDIRIASLSGNLNSKHFEGSADYYKTQTAANVNLDFVMDGLILNAYPVSSANNATAQKSSSESGVNKVSTTPLNLTLKIKTGEIKIPYLHAERGAILNASLTKITDGLDKISGTASFNVSDGTIENLDKLVQSNNAAKVVFTALSAVQQASTLLGISGLAKQQQWNSLRYNSFSGDLNFLNGKMTINNMNFISPTVSVKLTGTTDFKTEKLNMRANIHPGANNPIVINIGGTISNPQSNIDAASSAVAIFGKDSIIGRIGAMFGGRAE